MITRQAVDGFLAQRRIAVVGASDDKSNFGKAIYGALREHGYDVVAVNPNAQTVAGDPCYPSLADVDGGVDAAMLVVNRSAAVKVLQDCAGLGIGKAWLFKGLGGPGAVSEEALEYAKDHRIELVPGACPLMFLEPAALIHRIHRRARQVTGAVERA